MVLMIFYILSGGRGGGVGRRGERGGSTLR